MQIVKKEYPDAEVLMGTSTAGIAHAAITAHLLDMPMGYVRGSNKDHGRNNKIEGKLLPGQKVVVIEDLISTGGSAIDAITMIKKRNVSHIKFVCIIAAPQGIEALRKAHPDVDIYVAAIDEKLNEHAYIIPGLGDAGDRIFGTK